CPQHESCYSAWILAAFTSWPRTARPSLTMAASSAWVLGATARPSVASFSFTASVVSTFTIALLRRSTSGSGRREERDPRRHFKAWAGFANGGDVRHARVAAHFHDRHDLDLAAPEMRNRGRKTEEGDLDMPAQQIVDGGAAAAIRHVNDVDA